MTEPRIDLAELKRLYLDQAPPLTVAQIADRLGVAEGTVIRNLRRLDVPRRGGGPATIRTQEQEQLLCRLWHNRAVSVDMIAERLGVARGTVTNWVFALRLPYPRPVKYRPDQRIQLDAAELRAAWADRALSLSDIASKLGVSVPVVTARAAEMGLPSPRERRLLDPDVLRAAWFDTSVTQVKAARSLGVSVGKFHAQAHALGLPRRPYAVRKAINEAALREMWADPTVSTMAMARKLGVSDSSVRRRAAALNLDPRPRLHRAQQYATTFAEANAIRTMEAGLRQAAEVAEALGKLEQAGLSVPAGTLTVARIRVEHPDWSLTQIGEAAGVGKDAVAGRLRRLVVWAADE